MLRADDTELKFGGLLSTSNQLAADLVTITCDNACIWMTTIADVVDS